MIIPALHRQMVPLDPARHRGWRIHQPRADWRMAASLNSVFVAAAEFGDACREYPILFVRAGNDPQGKPQVAPIVALGLAPQENLYLQGSGWRAMYIPALLRAYPFAMAMVEGEPRVAPAIDTAWSGWSQTEGQPLYDESGQPGEYLKGMTQQLERFEAEVQRTRGLGQLLIDKDLLRAMRFDADLPDGQKLKVEGFLSVDEKQLSALGDADLLSLQRSGALALIYAHLFSLGNLRKLAQWRAEVSQAAAMPAPS